jgi:hypothetical protein
MSFKFDLSSFDDVRANADQILHGLSNGSMPGDGSWPPERVAMFREWVAAGCPPWTVASRTTPASRSVPLLTRPFLAARRESRRRWWTLRLGVAAARDRHGAERATGRAGSRTSDEGRPPG